MGISICKRRAYQPLQPEQAHEDVSVLLAKTIHVWLREELAVVSDSETVQIALYATHSV